MVSRTLGCEMGLNQNNFGPVPINDMQTPSHLRKKMAKLGF